MTKILPASRFGSLCSSMLDPNRIRKAGGAPCQSFFSGWTVVAVPKVYDRRLLLRRSRRRTIGFLRPARILEASLKSLAEAINSFVARASFSPPFSVHDGAGLPCFSHAASPVPPSLVHLAFIRSEFDLPSCARNWLTLDSEGGLRQGVARLPPRVQG